MATGGGATHTSMLLSFLTLHDELGGSVDQDFERCIDALTANESYAAPVYEVTKSLKLAVRNVDDVLAEVARFREVFEMGDQGAQRLSVPGSVEPLRFEDFERILVRTHAAVQFFRKNLMNTEDRSRRTQRTERSRTMAHVEALAEHLRVGTAQVVEQFAQCLKELSTRLEWEEVEDQLATARDSDEDDDVERSGEGATPRSSSAPTTADGSGARRVFTRVARVRPLTMPKAVRWARRLALCAEKVLPKGLTDKYREARVENFRQLFVRITESDGAWEAKQGAESGRNIDRRAEGRERRKGWSWSVALEAVARVLAFEADLAAQVFPSREMCDSLVMQIMAECTEVCVELCRAHAESLIQRDKRPQVSGCGGGTTQLLQLFITVEMCLDRQDALENTGPDVHKRARRKEEGTASMEEVRFVFDQVAFFDQVDAAHSGSIGFSELKLLTDKLGARFAEVEVEELMGIIDDDGNGTIDFHEFFEWYSGGSAKNGGESIRHAILRERVRAQHRPNAAAPAELDAIKDVAGTIRIADFLLQIVNLFVDLTERSVRELEGSVRCFSSSKQRRQSHRSTDASGFSSVTPKSKSGSAFNVPQQWHIDPHGGTHTMVLNMKRHILRLGASADLIDALEDLHGFTEFDEEYAEVMNVVFSQDSAGGEDSGEGGGRGSSPLRSSISRVVRDSFSPLNSNDDEFTNDEDVWDNMDYDDFELTPYEFHALKLLKYLEAAIRKMERGVADGYRGDDDIASMSAVQMSKCFAMNQWWELRGLEWSPSTLRVPIAGFPVDGDVADAEDESRFVSIPDIIQKRALRYSGRADRLRDEMCSTALAPLKRIVRDADRLGKAGPKRKALAEEFNKAIETMFSTYAGFTISDSELLLAVRDNLADKLQTIWTDMYAALAQHTTASSGLTAMLTPSTFVLGTSMEMQLRRQAFETLFVGKGLPPHMKSPEKFHTAAVESTSKSPDSSPRMRASGMKSAQVKSRRTTRKSTLQIKRALSAVGLMSPRLRNQEHENDLPNHFLQAARFDHDVANAMWLHTKEWREEHSIADSCNPTTDRSKAAVANFAEMKRIWPSYFHGRDRDDRVIQFHLVGEADASALTGPDAEAHIKELIDHFIFTFEWLFEVHLAQPKHFIVVFDCAGLPLSSLKKGSVHLSIAKRFTDLLRTHYPMRCAEIFFINVPRLFKSVLKLHPRMLGKAVRGTMRVIRSGAHVKEALRKNVDEDQLTPDYGGTGTEVFGEGSDDARLTTYLATSMLRSGVKHRHLISKLNTQNKERSRRPSLSAIGEFNLVPSVPTTPSAARSSISRPPARSSAVSGPLPPSISLGGLSPPKPSPAQLSLDTKSSSKKPRRLSIDPLASPTRTAFKPTESLRVSPISVGQSLPNPSLSPSLAMKKPRRLSINPLASPTRTAPRPSVAASKSLELEIPRPRSSGPLPPPRLSSLALPLLTRPRLSIATPGASPVSTQKLGIRSLSIDPQASPTRK
tara:strand:+ start:312 stop:4757 length:4446 start_codon:yes stop_codon:yes gene_type:complete